MQIESLVPLFAYIAIGVIGWFTKTLWDADNELRDSVFKLREEIPGRYVLRDDFHRDMGEIKQLLRDIMHRLDEKADR